MIERCIFCGIEIEINKVHICECLEVENKENERLKARKWVLEAEQ